MEKSVATKCVANSEHWNEFNCVNFGSTFGIQTTTQHKGSASGETPERETIKLSEKSWSAAWSREEQCMLVVSCPNFPGRLASLMFFLLIFPCASGFCCCTLNVLFFTTVYCLNNYTRILCCVASGIRFAFESTSSSSSFSNFTMQQRTSANKTSGNSGCVAVYQQRAAKTFEYNSATLESMCAQEENTIIFDTHCICLSLLRKTKNATKLKKKKGPADDARENDVVEYARRATKSSKRRTDCVHLPGRIYFSSSDLPFAPRALSSYDIFFFFFGLVSLVSWVGKKLFGSSCIAHIYFYFHRFDDIGTVWHRVTVFSAWPNRTLP